jgi:hypothetical protein
MADWTPDEQAELEKIVDEIETRDKESDEESEGSDQSLEDAEGEQA